MKRKVLPIDLLSGSSVPVHLIAQQAYCELQVDLELRDSESRVDQNTRKIIESSQINRAGKQVRAQVGGHVQKKDLGKAFHKSVLDTVKQASVTENLSRLKAKTKVSLAESSLQGHFKGLPIIGKPDATHFDGNGNAWVVEWKVRNERFLTASDDAQLRLYGFLLKQVAKVALRKLSLVGVVVPHRTVKYIDAGFPATLPPNFIERVCTEPPNPMKQFSRWDEHKATGAPRKLYWARVTNYDEIKAVSELTFFRDYWVGKRDPIPTRNPEKCSVCFVNLAKLCPVAKVEYGR